MFILREKNQLGMIAWLQGDYAAARSQVEKGLEFVQEKGLKVAILNLQWMLGIIVGESGDFARAEKLLSTARAESKEMLQTYATMGTTRDLGTVLCHEGRLVEAVPLLDEAISIARGAPFEAGVSWSYSALGLAMIGLGDFDRAEAYFRESLMLARKTEKHRIPDCLEGLAEIDLTRAEDEDGGSRGHLERAAALLGAVEAARRLLSSKIIPVRGPVRERLLSEVHVQLGELAYRQSYELGKVMNLEEAIRYALEDA